MLTDGAWIPGERLRSEREAQGMSLEEAARITCIGKSYLEALESGQYERLPNPAYIKGIIRSYAQVLGIAPEPLIARYEHGTGPDDETRDRTDGEEATAGGRKPWILLLLIGVIICIGYMLAQQESGRDLPPSPAGGIMSAQTPSLGVFPPRTSHARPAAAPAAPLPAPAREERAEQSPPSGARSAILKVTVVEECLLTITIDDAPSQQYDLKPGDQVEWMGERYFALEMSNAGAVEAVVNDRALPPLGKNGASATVVITADGQIE